MTRSLLVLACVLGAVSPAVAQVFDATYEAGTSGAPTTAPDPPTQGWLLSMGANPGLSVGDVSPDTGFGVNAWNIADSTTAAGQFTTYGQAMSTAEHDFANSEGWRYSTELRFVDAFGTVAPGSVCIEMQYGQAGDGDRRWLLFFGLDAAGDLMVRTIGGNGQNHVVTSGGTGTDAYHSISMQTTNPGVDDQVTVVVDGVVLQTDYTGEISGCCASDGPEWGCGSSAGMGSGNFHRVEFVSDPCAIPVVTCTSDCATGDVAVEIAAVDEISSYTVTLDGGGTPVVATGGAILAGGTMTELFPALDPGSYAIDFEGVCASGETVRSACSITVAVVDPSQPIDLVWCAELPSDVDSCSALIDALLADGRDPVLIGDLDSFDCLASVNPGSNLWVLLGTFPDHRCLSAVEGELLVEALSSGIHLYIEGGDTWGFCGGTALWDFDGVNGRTADGIVIDDGDDTFLGMVGLAHAALDLTGFDAAYQQDQAGSDWVDRLVPTSDTGGSSAVDIPGGNAGVIWNDDGTGGATPTYATGIYYVAEAPYGRVIAQSWEFGGYGGDRDLLLSTYAAALEGTTSVELFRRGDANGDGAFDISDAVYALAALFIVGSPPVECTDAGDSNDDGVFDISDGVYILGALFIAGSPPPPDPDPSACGPDPTADAIDCATSPCP